MKKLLILLGILSSAASEARTDLADYKCMVVLRSAESANCVLDQCILTVTVDVSPELQARPMILFRNGNQQSFSTSAPLEEIVQESGRYRRFISLSHSMPGILIQAGSIELIPFVEFQVYSLFDHNVIDDPLGNYRLHDRNNYSYKALPRVCP